MPELGYFTTTPGCLLLSMGSSESDNSDASI